MNRKKENKIISALFDRLLNFHQFVKVTKETQ